jgi:hypothetical protein
VHEVLYEVDLRGEPAQHLVGQFGVHRGDGVPGEAPVQQGADEALGGAAPALVESLAELRDRPLAGHPRAERGHPVVDAVALEDTRHLRAP